MNFFRQRVRGIGNAQDNRRKISRTVRNLDLLVIAAGFASDFSGEFFEALQFLLLLAAQNRPVAHGRLQFFSKLGNLFSAIDILLVAFFGILDRLFGFYFRFHLRDCPLTTCGGGIEIGRRRRPRLPGGKNWKEEQAADQNCESKCVLHCSTYTVTILTGGALHLEWNSEFTLTIGTPTLKQKPQRMMSLGLRNASRIVGCVDELAGLAGPFDDDCPWLKRHGRALLALRRRVDDHRGFGVGFYSRQTNRTEVLR